MALKSLVNFRPLGGEVANKNDQNMTSRNTLRLKVFRSAALDDISEEDVYYLEGTLNIRNVFDLRIFEQEYLRISGRKMLDTAEGGEREANIQTVNGGKMSSHKIDVEDLEKNGITMGNLRHSIRHTFISLFNLTSIFSILWRTCGFFEILLCALKLLGDLFTKSDAFKIYFKRKVIGRLPILDLYKIVIDNEGTSVRAVLRLMNTPGNLPCVICCQHGKDRTGIISALLLGMMGYSDELIVSDYANTAIEMGLSHPSLKMYSANLRSAERETMEGLLQYIRIKYGSIPQYLNSIGFSKAEQLELCGKLRY